MSPQARSYPCKTRFSALKMGLAGLAALFMTACAHTGAPVPSIMAGAPVAAPMGLFEFCVRNPGECSLDHMAPRVEAEAVVIQTAGAGDAASTVALDIDARRHLSEEARSPADDAREPEAQVMIARAINAYVNQAMTYRSDREVWAVEDYWALPLSHYGIAYGDCEDYALEKRALLLAAGAHAHDVRLALVWSRMTGDHAVLLVRIDGVDYVLDNADMEMRPVYQTPYQWLAVQNGDSLLSWAEAQTQAPSDDALGPQSEEAIVVAGAPEASGVLEDHASHAAVRVPDLRGSRI